MFAALLVLPTVLPLVSAQSLGEGSGFIGDGLAIGTLSILGIFEFLFLIQVIHCFVVLVLASGHRWSYLILLFCISSNLVSLIGALAEEALFDQGGVSVSNSVLIALDALVLLFGNWSTILLYCALVAFLWDREGAIRTASGGSAGGHNPVLTGIHIVLILLMTVFGTAAPGVFLDAEAQSFNDDATFLEYDRRINTYRNLNYVFNAFVFLTGISFFVSALLLYRNARRAAVRDPISNKMVFVVNPLYALYLLCNSIIFTIVYSPVGPLPGSNARRSAVLAGTLIIQGFFFVTIANLLFFAIRRANWDVQPANGTAGNWSQSSQQQSFYGSPQMFQPQHVQSYYGQPHYPQQPAAAAPQMAPQPHHDTSQYHTTPTSLASTPPAPATAPAQSPPSGHSQGNNMTG